MLRAEGQRGAQSWPMLTQEDPWEEGKLGSDRTRDGKREGEG